MFIETHIVCHLICEATRFSVAFEISDRSAASILKDMCTNWFRVFGPPEMIVSDREGSLTSEEASLFGEHWNVLFKFKAKGSHAQVVERHHEILRDLLHKLVAQLRLESLIVSFKHVLAEAVFAKNAMTSTGGYTAHIMLYLAEFLTSCWN